MATSGNGGRTFHILTCPSLEPVAIVWCVRLQVFDQARVVTEFEEDFEVVVVVVVVGGEMTSKEEVC
jgi:hypothetical protein